MNIDNRFGIVLKQLRAEKHISQEELALNVGLHRTYISQLERGLKSPSLRTISCLCREFNISLVTLAQRIENGF